MEAVPAPNPALRVSPLALMRQPLAWAAMAAFLGSAVGLAGTFSWAVWTGTTGGHWATLAPGGLLAALSLFGVASLLGRRSWAAWVGVVLLLLWLATSISYVLYSTWLRGAELGLSGAPPVAFLVLVHAFVWGGSAAVLPFALGALFVARKRRLGAVLVVLSVPGMLLFLYAFPAGADLSLREIAALVGPLTLPGAAGVGVPEAVLWVLLGVMLLGEARHRAEVKLRESTARENKEKARRLYEEALGRGDLSVVDKLVTEDFRDLGRGTRGKLGMERFVADLRTTYPDLEVSVESQEAEGELVRTRLLISGTDRGSGVLWYPPTGRRVSFKAEFVDRFRGGELVEHAGKADTRELLRQLGHPEEDR